jgi:hypothetical protein
MTKWVHVHDLNIPEERQEQSYANAVWIQRNLYLHNSDSFKAKALVLECTKFLRAANFRRDVVSGRI